jgi:hypothetical protein
MAGSLRLLLEPIGTPGREFQEVQGCTLRLAKHGAGTTSATKSAVPAKIEFVGRFKEAVRTRPLPDERALGELDGTIELAGGLREPLFRCDPASLDQLRNPPADPATDGDLADFTPREVELKFLDAFTGAEGDAKKPRLRLPADAGKFRYLEVVAKLTIGGAAEADFNQNDTLDVLIRVVPPEVYPFSL